MNFHKYRTAVEALPIGKRLPDAVYLHESALGYASEALIVFTSRVAEEHADDFSWNVAKYFRRDFKISLLAYPTFLDESYPALVASITIDLVRGQSRRTDYGRSNNPPILHRKESLVAPDHPAYAEFAAITREGEDLGLYEKAQRIGFKQSWERAISSRGYTLVGGRLAPKARAAQPEKTLRSHVQIERHRTAIDRDQLSAPMQFLARHGYLGGDYTVLDYGCGKGHDVMELEAHGIDVVGWDPIYHPDSKLRVSDIVNLGFVINVIENPVERIAALNNAFGCTERVLAVAAMLGGENTVQKFTPFKDGVITSRNTFQKYYSQSELRSFIETTLARQAVAVAPGIFFIFKDELEEQRFLSNRQRVRREWRQITVRDKAAPVVDFQKLIEEHIEVFQAFWTACLDFGRIPANDEFDRSDELRNVIGSHARAFDASSRYFGYNDFDGAHNGRIEDITVFLALSFFGRRESYARMPISLQRDIKAFFGKPSIAREIARLALFSVADTRKITEACLDARDTLGCGRLEPDHSYTIHASQLSMLPGILRIYVGCALQLYGDIDGVDLMKIHMKSGKVSLLIYDDFTKPLPMLKQRIKIRLRDQEIDWFYYGEDFEPQPLYLKSEYLADDDPQKPAQEFFDQRIVCLKDLDPSDFGPTFLELERILTTNGTTLEEMEREYYERTGK